MDRLMTRHLFYLWIFALHHNKSTSKAMCGNNRQLFSQGYHSSHEVTSREDNLFALWCGVRWTQRVLTGSVDWNFIINEILTRKMCEQLWVTGKIGVACVTTIQREMWRIMNSTFFFTYLFQLHVTSSMHVNAWECSVTQYKNILHYIHNQRITYLHSYITKSSDFLSRRALLPCDNHVFFKWYFECNE